MGSSRKWKRAKRHGTGEIELKMSEVLLDFAEPMLAGLTLPEDRAPFETAIKMASVLWNAAVSPPEGGLARVYAMFEREMGEPIDEEVKAMFDRVVRRGRARYPHVRRIIVQAKVDVDDEGTCRVRVASSELT